MDDTIIRIEERLPNGDAWLNERFSVHARQWDRVAALGETAATTVSRFRDEGASRRDIGRVAAEFASEPTAQHSVSLFVTCQMWGTGTGDNRGAWRTEQALSASDAPETLLDVAAHVNDGRLGEAYQRAPWLPQWGPSFLTKFTYGVALGLNWEHPAAFVLDDRVRASLSTLEWTPPAEVPQYEAYCDAVAGWGDELDTRPDAVEWALWTASGTL